MKRFLSWCLLLVLLLPVVAIAESASFDFAGKSYSELVEIQAKFNAAYTRALASLPSNPGERVDEATRRSPAVVGQHIKVITKVDDYTAEIDLVVEEIFRGDSLKIS